MQSAIDTRRDSGHLHLDDLDNAEGQRDEAYFEDDEERANATELEVARKAPRVLNEYTLAQPCLDRHHRYRCFILAMEKCLITNAFHNRFPASLHGMVFTHAFFAYQYFVDSKAEFKVQMNKLAYPLPDAQRLPHAANLTSTNFSSQLAWPSDCQAG